MATPNEETTREVIKNLNSWAQMIKDGDLTGLPEALETQANLLACLLGKA